MAATAGSASQTRSAASPRATTPQPSAARSGPAPLRRRRIKVVENPLQPPGGERKGEGGACALRRAPPPPPPPPPPRAKRSQASVIATRSIPIKKSGGNGIALVMKSAPAGHTGSTSSLLGV